jgi:HD-like signal output (HDOD) protein
LIKRPGSAETTDCVKPASSDPGPSPTLSAPRPWWFVSTGSPPRDRPPIRLSDSEKVLAARVVRQTQLGNLRIPQIPDVAARVIAMLVKPEAEAGEVARLIHEDQQLAADVIAFSNSSLFAGATKNTNIPQAIGRVGFRRTRSLIFAASLRAVVYGGSELARAEAMWRHACGAAAIASRIAENLRQNADDLYLAGLFHDVGKPVVLSVLDTIAMRSRSAALRPELVDHMLVTHQGRVGIEVGRHWKLPEQAIAAIACHDDAGGTTLSKAQAIVAIANNACFRLNLGETDDGRPIAGPAALDALGATEADLPRLLEGVRDAATVG